MRKVIHEARRKMLDLEIKSKYARSDAIKKELYSLHLYLLNNVHPVMWELIESETFDVVNSKYIKKCKVQKGKFRAITRKEPVGPVRKVVRPNFVTNRSSQAFSEDEMELLNKGLKYRPKPR